MRELGRIGASPSADQQTFADYAAQRLDGLDAAPGMPRSWGWDVPALLALTARPVLQARVAVAVAVGAI